MRIVAIVLGAVLLLAAVRDRQGQLWALFKGDFEPGQKGNFVAWFAAIFLIGALGYVDTLRPVANTMLALVILVLLISNRGFFAQLQQSISETPKAGAAA